MIGQFAQIETVPFIALWGVTEDALIVGCKVENAVVCVKNVVYESIFANLSDWFYFTGGRIQSVETVNRSDPDAVVSIVAYGKDVVVVQSRIILGR